MSRAFIKEPDGDEDPGPLLERMRAPGPNYVTPRGMRMLRRRVQELKDLRGALPGERDGISARAEIQGIERELRYVEQALQEAVVVDPKRQAQGAIRFGAVVCARTPDGEAHEFSIVGEDEAGSDECSISFRSPLAQALIGKKAGDRVVWERPAGAIALEVSSFHYPDHYPED